MTARYLDEHRNAPVHSIDITPAMRERILKGLPAYAKGGRVPIKPVSRHALLLARKGVHDRNGKRYVRVQ